MIQPYLPLALALPGQIWSNRFPAKQSEKNKKVGNKKLFLRIVSGRGVSTLSFEGREKVRVRQRESVREKERESGRCVRVSVGVR